VKYYQVEYQNKDDLIEWFESENIEIINGGDLNGVMARFGEDTYQNGYNKGFLAGLMNQKKRGWEQ
jgi:hypothetical protein